MSTRVSTTEDFVPLTTLGFRVAEYWMDPSDEVHLWVHPIIGWKVVKNHYDDGDTEIVVHPLFWHEDSHFQSFIEARNDYDEDVAQGRPRTGKFELLEPGEPLPDPRDFKAEYLLRSINNKKEN